MPFYRYQSEAGQVHDVYASMADAPPIGHQITVDGVLMVRQPPDVRNMLRIRPTRYVTSQSLPRRQHWPAHWPQPTHGFDPSGRARFSGQERIDEWCKATQDSPDPVAED